MSLMLTTDRVLLPRWRLFHNAENFDEINHVNRVLPTEEERIDHLNAVEEWRTNNNLENAIELCASAIVHGYFDDAQEAATFILDSRPPSKAVIAMAKKVSNPNQEAPHVVIDNPRSHIANLKKKTHRSPSNPIFWADIALLYSSLGQNEKAKRAIKNALILAPNNRFIVRCATRFFMHINKATEARRVVENYQFLKQDPWVLSVELSIAQKQKRKSKYLKLSKNAIEKGRILPFHSSELASALGVAEMAYGTNKQAKKLFEHSLIEPTDNSVAQAQWVKSYTSLEIPLEANIINKDVAHEAQYYKLDESGDWGKAMKSANKWAKYEPYSLRPFEFMSYITLVCQDDPKSCIEHSKNGLYLKANDFTFLNNRTVAYAQIEKISLAEEEFQLIKTKDLQEVEKPVYIATAGMLAFRKNHIDTGRMLYQTAIEQFDSNKYENKKNVDLARLFWAREEIIAKTDKSSEFFQEMKNKMKLEKSKDVIALKENIEKLLSGKNRSQN